MTPRRFSLLLAALASLFLACGGSGESSSENPGQGGSSAGGQGGSNSTGGSSAGGTSQGGSGTAGQNSGGTAQAGTSGAAGSSGNGTGGTLIGLGGQGGCGTTACTDCIDNDGDGLIDGFDPECTGYLDNDEGTFATGIPGDNVDACKQDCFFDGNSGQGDDGCNWDLACDPLNPGANLDKACPYDPDKKNCPGPPSQQCIDSCMKNVPNGCDCFGCCAFQTSSGPKAVLLLPGCSYDKINDPLVCPPCTQAKECNNPCETCEYCLGKTELPPECTGSGGTGAGGSGTAGMSGAGGSTGKGGTSGASGSGGSGPLPQCPTGVQPCTQTSPCASGYYCLTGCCQAIIN